MMRREEEIQRAIRHLTDASKSSIASDRILTGQAVLLSMIDLLNWTLNKPSRFQQEVQDACDMIDRAERQ